MKKAVKRKAATKTKVAKASAEHVETLIRLDDIPPVPLLVEALTLAVDKPQDWGKTGRTSAGMVMSAMPRMAKIAAKLTMGARCFFCGTTQKERSKETVLDFHPEYVLCECLTKHRNMNHDYVPGWDTVEGLRKLVTDVESGALSRDAALYQFRCEKCKHGPTVYPVRAVYSVVKKVGSYRRRKHCDSCFAKFKKQSAPLPVPLTGILVSSLEQGAQLKKSNKKGREKIHVPITPVPAPEAAQEAPTPG